MVGKQVRRMDEGLMMMQELEDRLKEQVDRLEHVRLAAAELKDNLSGNSGDLRQSIAEHGDWLNQLTERVETLQMNTTVFVQ
ncbi:endothelial differentiation-related factor 1 isoform X2, partial [Clarias magur]